MSFPSRTIIVGAGASKPFQLPLAGELLEKSVERVQHLQRRKYDAENRNIIVLQSTVFTDEIDKAIVDAMGGYDQIAHVAAVFRQDRVQHNLDDFVRDHPSLTSAVSTLIAAALFESLYSRQNGAWELRSNFQPGGLAPEKDWMRSLVGVVRPTASKENKLAIISFNYDGLVERSMRMYWGGSERQYAPLEDCVEFVYPHGKFSELPGRVGNARTYLLQQAANLRLGDNRDEEARTRAKAIVATKTKLYAVGFSFSANNRELLGIDAARLRGNCFVQNYKGEDRRLTRMLNDAGASARFRDDGDMDSLIRHGFFEQ